MVTSKDIEEVGEFLDKHISLYAEEYHKWYTILPHRCCVSNRIIWPFQTAYVKITEYKFQRDAPKIYIWIHKDEYVWLKLKGKI